MTTTEQRAGPPATVELQQLFEAVNAATAALRRSQAVPPEVAELVDSLGSALHAEAPLRLGADPYLTTMLFAAALQAGKALRHDNAQLQRRELRVALEQFRQALRDIVSGTPFGADTPVKAVLATAASVMSVPQKDLADLLGVSTRQLQRWLAPEGPSPVGDDEARIRIVAQLINQLRHAFTGPGVMAWFRRRHPTLRAKPADWLDDPLRYPRLLAAATGSRAMIG